MKTAEIIKRLEKLEARAGIGDASGARIEFEDLRETEISIYGEPAIREIETKEGRNSLIKLAQTPDIKEAVRKMIADYLTTISKRRSSK